MPKDAGVQLSGTQQLLAGISCAGYTLFCKARLVKRCLVVFYESKYEFIVKSSEYILHLLYDTPAPPPVMRENYPFDITGPGPTCQLCHPCCTDV